MQDTALELQTDGMDFMRARQMAQDSLPDLLAQLVDDMQAMKRQREEDQKTIKELLARLKTAEDGLIEAKNKCRDLFQEARQPVTGQVLRNFDLVDAVFAFLDFNELLNASKVNKFFRAVAERSPTARKTLQLSVKAASSTTTLMYIKVLPILRSGLPIINDTRLIERFLNFRLEDNMLRLAAPSLINHVVTHAELKVRLNDKVTVHDWVTAVDSLVGKMYPFSPMPARTEIQVTYCADIWTTHKANRDTNVHWSHGKITAKVSVGKATLGEMVAVVKALVLGDVWSREWHGRPVTWEWPGLMPFAGEEAERAAAVMINQPTYTARAGRVWMSWKGARDEDYDERAQSCGCSRG